MKKSNVLFPILAILACGACALVRTGNFRTGAGNHVEIPETIGAGLNDIREDVKQIEDKDVIYDELFYDNEENVSFLMFRSGDSYFLSKDEDPGWQRVEGTIPEEAELKDFGFAKVTADLTLLDGGIAGYMNAPCIDKVISFENCTVDNAYKAGLVTSYDQKELYFIGPRVYETGDKTYYIVYSNYRDYRLYESTDARGSYPTLFEAEVAMGIRPSVPDGTGIETNGSLALYVFRCGDTYLAYSRYDGYSDWSLLYNKDMNNMPTGFELEDGETIYINGAEVVILKTDNGSNIMILDTDDALVKEKLGIGTLTFKTSPYHWEEGIAEGDIVMYQYGGGNTMILYMDGRYHVYSDNSDTVFIGSFDTPDEVDKILMS